ncbi:MAG: zinc dependent phospholipase C family protein [Kofleriaceae bacterium]
MPAEGIHLTAVREATAAPQLSPAVRRRLVKYDDAARFGAILVDLPYFHRYALEVARYLTGRPAGASRWGAELHEGGAVGLLQALVERARRDRDPVLGAIALGVASHCAMDRALHPLVNSLARKFPVGKSHDASHREVEKFQSICFHEAYLGRDTMGTAEISGYLTIRLAGTLEVPHARAIRDAWRASNRETPTQAELAGLRRGYRMHAGLLGTPLGKLVAPPAAKEAARPRYLAGAWGNFESLLAAAVQLSLRVLDAAGAALDASDHDAKAALAALATLLPAGTIDPGGEDVDLARPWGGAVAG